MAHTKAQRAVRGNRDSAGRRLGVKKFGGELVEPGNIIMRQQGTKFKAGEGTMLCNDFTIMALKKGSVGFKTRLGQKYIFVK
ncbi:MAG: 50S ribosomal protein L27 [Patescibacteria group bacterium]